MLRKASLNKVSISLRDFVVLTSYMVVGTVWEMQAGLEKQNNELKDLLKNITEELTQTRERRAQCDNELQALNAAISLCCDSDSVVSQRLLGEPIYVN
jgi:hypothetical protein